MKYIILNFSTSDYYRKLQTSVLLLLLVCFSFVFVPYLVSAANAATDINTEVSWKPVYLALSDGNAVDFGSITPSGASDGNVGTMKVIKKNISVSTNGKAVAVYLAMEGNSNRLDYGGESASTLGIPAISGSTPTSFSDAGWGYATAGAEPFASKTLYGGPFNTAMTKTSHSSYYNTGVWAAVPTSGNEEKIWSSETSNTNGFGTYENASGTTVTGDSNNNFDVYYAVVVDDDLVSGTYSNKVVYTALASTDSLDATSNNLVVTNNSSNGLDSNTKRYVANGDSLTLEFDLAATDVDFLEESDIEVYLVPHSTVASANYTVDSSNASDPIYANKSSFPVCKITDFSITTSTTTGATIDCNIGEGSSVVPNIVSTTATNEKSDGYYDVWVNIENTILNKNYLSKYLSSGSEISTLAFVGLQSHSDTSASSSNYVVDTMQNMTSSVCKNTNMWGTGYGSGARVYDYTGTGTAKASTAAGSAAIGVGTFLLADVRETVSAGGLTISGTKYKSYLVRRLADGNCWMVQNLDYDLAANRELKTTTSNVSSNKTIPLQNLSDTIGSTCSAQFQPRGVFGSNCFWGSLKDASGNTIDVANNARSSFARSYNYNLGYLTGTSNTKDPTTCAAITGDSAQWRSECQMPGAIGNQSSGTNDGTTQDTTWQPELISTSDGDTFTMRGSMYYGDYYNWYAATAESGKYNMGTNANATESICPRGWRLPINGNEIVDKSWQKLVSGAYKYNVVDGAIKNGYFASNRVALNKMMQLPLSIPFAGNYEWTNGALGSRGSTGNYWSSTATSTGDGTNAYSLNMNYGGYLNAQYYRNKTTGFTVRCVAE